MYRNIRVLRDAITSCLTMIYDSIRYVHMQIVILCEVYLHKYDEGNDLNIDLLAGFQVEYILSKYATQPTVPSVLSAKLAKYSYTQPYFQDNVSRVTLVDGVPCYLHRKCILRRELYFLYAVKTFPLLY